LVNRSESKFDIFMDSFSFWFFQDFFLAALQSTVSYAPAFGDGSSARSAVPPLNREDHASKKLNGYVNGNNDMADEDVDSPA
jgi:hypothetical protein